MFMKQLNGYLYVVLPTSVVCGFHTGGRLEAFSIRSNDGIIGKC